MLQEQLFLKNGVVFLILAQLCILLDRACSFTLLWGYDAMTSRVLGKARAFKLLVTFVHLGVENSTGTEHLAQCTSFCIGVFRLLAQHCSF